MKSTILAACFSFFLIDFAKSQENLIFNGSFEEFTPIGDLANIPSDFYYASHLDQFYYTNRDNFDGNSNSNADVICHQINCWETYDYETNVNISDAHYNRSSIMVFSSNQGFVPLQNPNHVFPFMIPYLADYTVINPFGNGLNVVSNGTITANHGDSYITMITNRFYTTEQCGTVYTAQVLDLQSPRIRTTLKEELAPNKTYKFRIDLAKIAHLNSSCGSDYSNSDNKDPKIEIRVYRSNGLEHSKTILSKKIKHLSWQLYEVDFEVNHEGYDRIEIKVNRSLVANEGVFIDNVQLYDPCETAENTCENPELFKPLFNINIHTLNIDGTTSQGVPYELKTVEVSNLMVAKYAKISITDMSGNTTYRVIYDGENPPPNITWDGKDDNGNVMPDGWYKCKVEASNLCYEETYTHKFQKQFEAQVFDPLIEVNADGGVTISGLNEAALAIVYVEHTLTGIELFAKLSVMPENEIAWNGTYDGNFGSAAIVESGFYLVGVLLQSNCGYEIYEKIVFLNEGDLSFSYLNGSFNDPLYDWAIVPDKIVPECTISGNLKPFYRVPKDCCVGDLYLDGENLWGDLTFNIVGTIYINNNVTTDPGSIITMNAGGEIILTPNSDGTEFTLGSDVHLNPNVICEPCDCNKSMSGENDTSGKEISTLVLVETSDQKTESSFVTISPNPSSEFVSVSFSNEKQFIAYKIYNVSGEFMQSGVIVTSPVRIDVSALPAGEYFIQLSTGMEFESYKIIVQ